jgi:transposase, IS5 family
MPTRVWSTPCGTSGNVADVTEGNSLLHGQEKDVFGDAGYQGADKRPDAKAGIRAKVEHPFRVIKRQFGFAKVRYRELKKNTLQLKTLFALSNLWMVRHKLMGEQA